MSDVVLALEGLVLVYFAVAAVLQVALMVSAGLELRDVTRQRGSFDTRDVLRSPFSPSVSVLVPAFDEETMIAETIESMLAIEYPGLEVVVVNDGSGDETFSRLQRRFKLTPAPAVDAGALTLRPIRGLYRSSSHPQLVVVDKDRGGKADALNMALVHASGRLVCAVDADTIIEPDAIERLVVPFLQDPSLLAAGGSVRPSNGCRLWHGRVLERRLPDNMLAAVQSIEYARAFLFGRLGWNRLGGNIIISGAFGLFDREAVIVAGGYLDETVGEDMELALRLRRRAIEIDRPSRISFVPEPMAWTEVPESFRTLARQRNRWHRGLLDTMWRHRHMVGRRRYGLVGTVVLPYYVLEAFSPLFELVGLSITIAAFFYGGQHAVVAASFLLLSYGLSVALSAVAVGFEDSLDDKHPLTSGRIRRVGPMLLEQIGYRQLTMVWRLWGGVRWLRGDQRWGAQVRKGIATDGDSTADGSGSTLVNVEPPGVE